MFIVRLTAENFKRLTLVEIDFDAAGGVTTISGPNGAGKTSTIDALASVIAGRNAPKIPNPIRKGAETAVVVAETDSGLIITRRWKRREDDTISTDLVISNADGMTRKSPQQLLDTFLAGYSLDPLAFATAKPADQVSTLLELVTLPFDLDALDQRYADVFATRTGISRDLDKARGHASSMPRYADAPAAEVSAADLVAELEAATAHERKGADLTRAAIQASHEANHALSVVRRAREALSDAEHALRAADEREEAAGHALEHWKSLLAPDHDALRARIDSVDETNAQVRANADQDRALTAAAALEDRHAALTAELAEIKRTRAEGLAAAEFPLPGLGFADGMVTLDGVPFSQASAAEQLVASIAIAGAANPTLRLVLIRDASLLDSRNRALVEEYAAAHDLRIVLELVDEHAESGVVISDGAS